MENLVGFCRWNFCVPVPRAESMDELNALLLEGCEHYLPVLERKGWAIFQARPVLDNVPAEFLN